MKIIFISAIFTFSCVSCIAQDSVSINYAIVKPGDGIVDGAFFKQYKNAWSMVAQRPGLKERNIGSWFDEAKITLINNRQVIYRTQVSVSVSGWDKYINIVNVKTFEPISSEFTDSHGAYSYTSYKTNKVVWKHKTRDSDKIDEKEIALSGPVYDYDGGMYGMTLVGFPLKAGYAAKFLSFNPSDGQQVWVRFSVEGEELVQAGPFKQVKAWIVKVNENPGDGSYQIFSISKEAPYIIQLIENSKNIKMTFRML